MKIEINLNKKETEQRIVIYATEMTEQLQTVINYAESTFNTTKLYGKNEDEIYPLNIAEINRIFTEDKQVYAATEELKFKVDKRLFELEAMLPNNFVRISQSEIININFIKKLKQEVNGFIKISFKNGEISYSSRRYLKLIKEALQL